MTAVLVVFEIVVGGIFSHHPVGILTRARGMEGVVLLSLGWRTRQSNATFGHINGSPEAVWPIC